MNREKPAIPPSSPVFHNAWIVSDGKVGDLVQCRGIAQALGVKADLRIVNPTKPWVWMMPYGPLPPGDHIRNKKSPIRQPLPDLVIASGWRTLAYVREIKKHKQDGVFTVFLKFPRSRADYLDLIWVPEHDHVKGDRVISSIASPHRFSPKILTQEYGQKPDYLDNLGQPLVGVILGGNSKDYNFSDDDCRRFARSLHSLAECGAGLAITPSRRSPSNLKNAIKKELAGKKIYWWDESDANPYGYILSHAGMFVVTADSANIVGEVCVTGKPVYYFKPSGGSKKFDRLIDGFEAYGAIRQLPEAILKLESWNYEPLYAAAQVAQEVEARAIRQFNGK
jgi:mitochondrial fission protein ELM1